MELRTAVFVSLLILLQACKHKNEITTSEPIESSTYTLIGEKNFLSGYPAIDSLGNVNVVIEIPTGTTEKWEVEKSTGNLKWEFVDGSPRTVKYLGYPGNYGMIPSTLLPKELGGDGDPLDVIVLGSAEERGVVLKTKIIGMLSLLDRGEQDDKLIAVVEDSPFFELNNLQELDSNFKGTTTIIETFFANYKGPGKMKPLGWANEVEAKKILEFSIEAYKNKTQ